MYRPTGDTDPGKRKKGTPLFWNKGIINENSGFSWTHAQEVFKSDEGSVILTSPLISMVRKE